MASDQDFAEARLLRVEALLKRWSDDDRQMREACGVPLLHGVVAICAEELSDALNG